jgi:hypothetical protein
VVRDRDEEASARDAAAEFLSGGDRADWDAAWSRTSARVKAVMSRVDFERRLSAMPHVDSAGGDRLYLSFAAPGERFLPGALIDAWLARETADGPAVEALTLRLDDDLEWRVAGVLELTAGSAPTAADVDRDDPSGSDEVDL